MARNEANPCSTCLETKEVREVDSFHHFTCSKSSLAGRFIWADKNVETHLDYVLDLAL